MQFSCKNTDSSHANFSSNSEERQHLRHFPFLFFFLQSSLPWMPCFFLQTEKLLQDEACWDGCRTLVVDIWMMKRQSKVAQLKQWRNKFISPCLASLFFSRFLGKWGEHFVSPSVRGGGACVCVRLRFFGNRGVITRPLDDVAVSRAALPVGELAGPALSTAAGGSLRGEPLWLASRRVALTPRSAVASYPRWLPGPLTPGA